MFEGSESDFRRSEQARAALTDSEFAMSFIDRNLFQRLEAVCESWKSENSTPETAYGCLVLLQTTMDALKNAQTMSFMLNQYEGDGEVPDAAKE